MKYLSIEENLIIEKMQKHLVDFYSQADQDLSKTIFSKKLFHLTLFKISSIISRFWFGRFVAYLIIFLFYNKYYMPSLGIELYAFGPTSNNVKVFRRLKEVTGLANYSFEINGTRLGFLNKISFLFSGVKKIFQLSGLGLTCPHINYYCNIQLLMAMVSYWFYCDVIKINNKIKVIIVANDHAPLPVGLIYASKYMNVPICYIQHAPVNSQFPPLQYDLSILHDRNSLNAYRLAGSLSPFIDEVNICFISRFNSNYKSIKIPESIVKSVGIALSFDTKPEVLLSLLKDLDCLGMIKTVFLKRHPRDKSSYSYLKVICEPAIVFVDGDDFYDKVDIAIVGNSGVAIDCLHYGIPTFYFGQLDDFGDDYFHFVSSGLIPRFINFTNFNFSHFDFDWKNKFSYFDSTLDIDLDIQSDKLRNVFYDKFNIAVS